MYLYVYMYICMYIYMKRKREKERTFAEKIRGNAEEQYTICLSLYKGPGLVFVERRRFLIPTTGDRHVKGLRLGFGDHPCETGIYPEPAVKPYPGAPNSPK